MSDAELIRERDRAIKRADTLEAEVWALGVQVVAQKARLHLAGEVIAAMRLFDHKRTDAALAAWDAVPTDDIARWTLRCQSTRAVGASLLEVEQCAGADAHRGACFGGVPPP